MDEDHDVNDDYVSDDDKKQAARNDDDDEDHDVDDDYNSDDDKNQRQGTMMMNILMQRRMIISICLMLITLLPKRIVM